MNIDTVSSLSLEQACVDSGEQCAGGADAEKNIHILLILPLLYTVYQC